MRAFFCSAIPSVLPYGGLPPTMMEDTSCYRSLQAFVRNPRMFVDRVLQSGGGARADLL